MKSSSTISKRSRCSWSVRRSQDAGFPLSYFELFVHGLTNIARSLYFGTDLAIELAEENLRINNSECGMGIGDEEDQFLFDYVKFLVSQDLAMIDFGDCLIDWEDRRMQPHFVAPLTSRGRRFLQMVGLAEDRLRSAGLLISPDRLRVAQERFFQMVFTGTDLKRVLLVNAFEALINRGAGVIDE